MAADESVNYEHLRRVRITLQAELGRTTLRFDEVEGLGPGSIITLERLTGEPIDVRCRGRVIAKGEVVVQDDNFAVRVTHIYGDRDDVVGHTVRETVRK